MAIQTVNLGAAVTGQGGDTPRSANTKINANFTDTTNAASKLVGTDGADKIAVVGKMQEAINSSLAITSTKTSSSDSVDSLGIGNHYIGAAVQNSPGWGLLTTSFTAGAGFFQMFRGVLATDLRIRLKTNNAWTSWAKVYHTTNTTLDGNGALKPSSPVLRVFNDRIEGNADGDTMAAMYTKNGVGDYTISGTTGLRTDGWYIVIPNDMNGNPKVAVTLDDTDGVITLKTYARVFDMSTFKFVPDLEEPMDVPDGRWIDLRFEDLPTDEV